MPIKLCGITLSPKLNTVQIVIPAMASVALIYVRWMRTPTTASK